MRHVKVLSVLVVLAVLGSAQWNVHAAALPQPGSSPTLQGGDAALVAQLTQATDNHVHVSHHAETGKVRFIGTDSQHPIQHGASIAGTVSGEQAARDFLSRYGSLFGLRDQAQELRMERSRSVQTNAFTRFQQTYNGVPVFGAEVSVQTTKDANVVSANGAIVPDIALDTTPRITTAQAKTIATGLLAKDYKVPASTFTASEPQLWAYNPLTLGAPGVRRTVLVWRMDVLGQVGVDPVRELVLVDAYVGAIALDFNQVAEGKDRRVCDFNNVPNPDNTCTPPKYVRTEGQPPTGQKEVDRAYDIHGAVYDFYYRNFGRDSIDNRGLPLIATVRYCPDQANCPYQNAFWDGRQMTYGDGFIHDDVVAHELTHGVTENESHLFYYYQSGAINESLSDVFGELFDLQYNDGGNDSPQVRWLIGEDLPGIGAIRSMKNPLQFGDPDRITSLKYYDRRGDNGGVHLNSGINNKATYLMADGDTFNGQTITGLGLYKTGYIYYVANTQYLLSASNYQDLGDILPQACDFLAQPGIAITTAADCGEVRKVVLATEMNQLPRGTAAPAPVCDANQAPNDVFFDNLENPKSGNWVSGATQPTTVSGINAWFYPQTANPFDFDATYATSGAYNFWGYDYGGTPGVTPPDQLKPADYNIAMTRDVTIPPNAYMHFRHSYDFEASAFNGFDTFDGGVVEYSLDGGKTYQDAGALFTNNGYNGSISRFLDNPLKQRDAFVDRSKGYTASRADLSSLAGKNVRFRFRIGTDSVYDSYGWFIDDIRIYTCDQATTFTNKTYMPMVVR